MFNIKALYNINTHSYMKAGFEKRLNESSIEINPHHKQRSQCKERYISNINDIEKIDTEDLTHSEVVNTNEDNQEKASRSKRFAQYSQGKL